MLAERPLPEEERYDGYLQLENGVGMITLLENEFKQALEEAEGSDVEKSVLVATGKLAAPIIDKLGASIKAKFPNVKVRVKAIRNDFFGESITVAGLITGQDLVAQVREDCQEDIVLIPICMLRSGEEVFLDDYTVTQVSELIQKPIRIVESEGYDLLQAMVE